MKRIVTLIVLCSMMLHCASRLGILSYLYQQRHAIAHTLGLIQEIPIALCSSDYDFNEGLSVQHTDDSDGLPVSIAHAHEITLFAPDHDASDSNKDLCFVEVTRQTPYIAPIFHSPYFQIFQPPRIS
jgi:hypothetical protein